MNKAPVARTQMMIRRPVQDVFNAFIDPAVTTRFWFTKSSGPLAEGKTVRWEWEMYGASTDVLVKAVEPCSRILIEWHEPPCPVEWQFEDRKDGTTLVVVANRGFTGSEDEMVAQAIDSMGGFSFMLASLKALLEHDIQLNLVADHHPDGHIRQ